MAMYHFTVKPDRKPSGQRIKAVDHSEYIDREGKYKDIDEERKFTENFIHGLERKNILDEDESALLYSSPYGEIKTNRKGIQVTDNPSAETLAIALMISKRALGDTVVVEEPFQGALHLCSDACRSRYQVFGCRNAVRF